jgi:transcriptional regulator with XRE-family HTH domain
MTSQDRPETPSDVVARRVQEVRKDLGWSAEKLAQECARVGAPRLTTSVIANIESGRRDQQGRRRRDVSVDELLAFAAALRMAPAHLLPDLEPPWPDEDVWPRLRVVVHDMLGAVQDFERMADSLHHITARGKHLAEAAERHAATDSGIGPPVRRHHDVPMEEPLVYDADQVERQAPAEERSRG